MYKEFGIKEDIIELSKKVEKDLAPIFKSVEEVEEYNSLKVLSAFQKYNLSEMHFNGTTGYGYGDIGRDTIENIFAEVFKAEDSLVRTQFISGTHAISTLLFGILRPNDTLISISGKPYDTLSGYLIELLGRIPSDDEKPVIETKRVTYKIEDYEEKRILWVKACRNNVEEDNDDENDEEDSKTSKEDTEKSED